MTEVFGCEVEVPFGPAPGVLNGPNKEYLVEKTKEMLKSPVGAVWIGSFTLSGGEGNAHFGRTYYHNWRTGQTVNSEGLPNIGIEGAEEILPDLHQFAKDRGKLFIPSFSPAKGDDPLTVMPEMAYRLAELGFSVMEANYSCGNKVLDDGGREPILAHDLETMLEVDQAITHAVGGDITVIAKLTPYVGDKKYLIPQVAEGFRTTRTAGTVALALSNTIINQRILTEKGDEALDVPNNMGGMSGPAAVEVGRQQLADFSLLLPEAVFVSCLGVDSGTEVYRRVDEMGADLACGVTVYRNGEEKGRSFAQTGRKVAEQYYDVKEEALSGSY